MLHVLQLFLSKFMYVYVYVCVYVYVLEDKNAWYKQYKS